MKDAESCSSKGKEFNVPGERMYVNTKRGEKGTRTEQGRMPEKDYSGGEAPFAKNSLTNLQKG